jgi:hypothetical protein
LSGVTPLKVQSLKGLRSARDEPEMLMS